mmetsp:Transcript_206/g.797  ORF Transcript_206/g.797 Transcript_206/m.797 type:complete len:250 (-) Transcript_206:223-972(-)
MTASTSSALSCAPQLSAIFVARSYPHCSSTYGKSLPHTTRSRPKASSKPRSAGPVVSYGHCSPFGATLNCALALTYTCGNSARLSNACQLGSFVPFTNPKWSINTRVAGNSAHKSLICSTWRCKPWKHMKPTNAPRSPASLNIAFPASLVMRSPSGHSPGLNRTARNGPRGGSRSPSAAAPPTEGSARQQPTNLPGCADSASATYAWSYIRLMGCTISAPCTPARSHCCRSASAVERSARPAGGSLPGA